MNRAQAVRLHVLKEARALLPIWLASAAAVVLGFVAAESGPLFPRNPFLLLLGLSAFVLGSMALGALSVGHEYACRTLPALLSQPLSRSRLLLSKAAVLMPLLAALAILARSMLLRADTSDSVNGVSTGAWIDAFTILVPVLGFCVAPWLTLIFRSAIAGAVFTLAIPAGLWLLLGVEPGVFGDVRTPQGYGPGLTAFWAVLLSVSAIALVDGPRRFFRLEATDGPRGISLAGTGSLRASGAETDRGRRRHPLAQLVSKELRLQRVAFLLPGFYVLTWAVIVAAKLEFSLGPAFFGMTLIYGGVTALLVGALASAEERALGTLAVQALQPLAAWKQWSVKLATALALAVAFTVLLPRVREWVHPLGEGQASWRLSAGLLALTASSLYVSSLSAGALQAMLLSMPFAAVIGSVFWVVTSQAARFEPLSYPFQSLSANWTRPIPLLSPADWTWYRWSESWLPVVVLFGLAALLIWFAARNHRSAEYGLGRLTRQMVWIAPCILIGGLISGALPPLVLWFLATH